MKRIATRLIALLIINSWNTLVVAACYATGILAMLGALVSYLITRFSHRAVAARWYGITASLDNLIIEGPAAIDHKYMLSL